MSTQPTPAHNDDSPAFLPYPPTGDNLEHVPVHVRPDAFYYRARMGFLPNAVKLYLHVPWIAEHLFRLNNAVMRDQRNGLDEEFKYGLAFAISRTNGCPYCVAHHACTLERRWQYDEQDLKDALDPAAPRNEREAVAMEFVRQASKDAASVTDEKRAALAKNFTPSEVMEIVLLAGFWKMYNFMHITMAVPIEDPLLAYKKWSTSDAARQS